MNDVPTVVDAYFALWNEPDPERRRELVSETFTEDASYLGPLVDGAGHDGIDALASNLHSNIREHLGPFRFHRTGDITAHHDVVRFSWEITPGNGDPLFAAGVDFGIIAADGRLRHVTTFLDVLPEGAGAH